ncbi:MAG: hypothetical protein ACLTZT_09840 [Butyricimonas faecalis]
MAKIVSPENGITVTILSDYPLQVYTGKEINVANGKGGKHYGPYSGIALRHKCAGQPSPSSFSFHPLESGRTVSPQNDLLV